MREKYDIIIGIDPDVNRNGVAVLDTFHAYMELFSYSFAELMELLPLRKAMAGAKGESLLVVVEASWMTEANWHGKSGDNRRQASSKGYDVGRNHETGKKIVEMAKDFGAKTVWTLHDYKLICPSYSCLCNKEICERCVGGNKFNVVKRLCMKGGLPGSILAYMEAEYWNRERLQRCTDVFICPSRFMADMMVKDGFDKDKLRVVCNSVSRDIVSGLEIKNVREHYYIYVGRLSKEKGVETLLSVANQLPYNLKIVGGGPLLAELKSHYASEKIEFLGHLSQSEVKKYVADAKFSVIPSEWYENNPLSVIESLCLGTPVAGARIGGIPELVKPGMGFLFRPGDADSLKRTIETAWEGQFDYGWISSNSINRFSEHRYLEEILDIYSR